MTLAELENLMGRAGLTQHQTRELLPAIHDYATTQASAAIDAYAAEPLSVTVHRLDVRHVAHVACGLRNENLVNSVNPRDVNCPDCLKGTTP